MTALGRGRFIVLEGGEGAGKSSHAHAVSGWLQARGRRAMNTREPGGSPLSEAIRGLVLGDWPGGVGPATEALLMFAARADHVRTTIEPALSAGIDVVCDRFTDASYAYQGAGRRLGEDRIAVLEEWTLGSFRPDLILVLDVDPALGLARAKARGDINRFEGESIAFANRVRAAYLARAAEAPHRYAVIDASQPMDEVGTAIREVLVARLQGGPDER